MMMIKMILFELVLYS